MEIGIYTFAEVRPDPYTGKMISPHQRIRDQASDEFYPSYAEIMSRLGRERGWRR